jgi:hypothetical protein
MSRCPRRVWCGAMGCISIRTPRPWPSAARHVGKRPWTSPCVWTGRRGVPSVGRPIPRGVLPVASGSCVRVLSRVVVRPRRYGLGSVRHEADTREAAGGGRSGGWYVWRWLGGVPPQARTRSGGLSGPGLWTTASQERRSGPVAGGMAWRCCGTNSVARRSAPCQAASVRGQSNQELSEVLRAGRESTAGLSPLSTPDSFLMCYRKLEKGLLGVSPGRTQRWRCMVGTCMHIEGHTAS